MSLEERISGFDSGLSALTQDTRLPAPLEVSVSWIKDTALMAIAGEVDASSVARLQQKLEDIASETRGDVIVDLGMVSFMDSTGLSFLIAAHKRLKARAARLVVFSPTPQLLRLFEITGLSQILTIEPFE
jgi:stage II sporulation protein AA (anti-sigma F factor antagonist)